MKRILISGVYHIVLGNKNICLLAKMMHLSKHLYDLSLYYPKSFLYQKSVLLSTSPTFPLYPPNICLRSFKEENLATVTVIKIIFLLLQNSSMYMHSSGTNHLVLTDYSPQVTSYGQIQNKGIQSVREFILVIILVIFLHAQKFRDINIF